MSSFPPPESAPPQPPQQSWPSAPEFQHLPYGQPYPDGPAPDGAFGLQAPYPAAPRSRALGITAMCLAIAVFGLSIVASVAVGAAVGPIATRTAGGFSYSTAHLTAEQAARFGATGVLIGAQLLLGTLGGVTALVLGIVSTATKRGRSFGITAIVLATAAPIVSFIVYSVVTLATLPPVG